MSRALDLEALRARLSATGGGPRFWRSLDDIAETPEFQEWLHREFPANASEFTDPVGRRHFLKIMGASIALAGATACTKQPDEKILPYVKSPEEVIPGKPLFFATSMTHGGAAIGLLVESHMGRPTKVEGNPEHPASLGATDALAQASVLDLYDPDRSQTVTFLGETRPWTQFAGAMTDAMTNQRAKKGAGLRLVTETVVSPTLARQIQGLLAEFPAAKWCQYETTPRDNARGGAMLAFGQPVACRYHFEHADVILSLDADFLYTGPGRLRYTREFSARRRVSGVEPSAAEMSRLYVVESTLTNTGVKADHRLAAKAGEIQAIAAAIASAAGASAPAGAPQPPASAARWIAAVAADLKAHAGAALVIAGDYQPPVVHAIAHALNRAIGAVGKTVEYTQPIEAIPVDHGASFTELMTDLGAGQVDLLLMMGVNPVYTAPADLDVATNLQRAAMRVHVGLHSDETSELCQWQVPATHYLEMWSDARAYNGAASIVQPLIAPLYENCKSPHEIISTLIGGDEIAPYDLIRDYWRTQLEAKVGAANFDKAWRKALHDGVITDSEYVPVNVDLRADWAAGARFTPPAAAESLEINFRLDDNLWDGRFANNAWLQELPRPLTKLTWDNAVLLSPATAAQFNVTLEDVVEVKFAGRSVEGPVWIAPGQARGAVTVNLGYGRTRTGRVGSGVGFNTYSIRPSATPWSGAGVEIVKTGRTYPLATTQEHHTMEGRHLVRTGPLEEYKREPGFIHEMVESPSKSLTMLPERTYTGHAWGMAVDLNACTGCNACITSCQSENNIPVVGKTQVRRGREMQWIRIDRYFEGDFDDPKAYYQPVLCMQCENAPCEVVCPVAATAHSSEGLNDMVYNRCVGTRYCSNNCPYKVRRFNFLLYSDWNTKSYWPMRNPDVTVRSRGVMEKCTYCVQRINAAKIEAEKEGRGVRDGDIVTACQSVCPAEAIVFGDINDPNSRVSKVKATQLNYSLMDLLDTRPRTTYLAALRNPNPALEESGSGH